MTTLAQLIDRTYRDWLEPADDQPVRLALAQSIDTDDVADIAYDADMIGPEELELLGPGTLIEVDSEEMILGDLDEGAGTFDIEKRAANGTTAAAHSSGAFIYPHRVWRRKVLFDALCDAVVKLYPDLYRVAASDSVSVATTVYTEVPSGIVSNLVAVKHFIGLVSGSSTYAEYPVSLLSPFPPSSTGKAFTVSGISAGSTGYLVYKSKFARPSAEADDLTVTFGVQQDWEQIVILDAVAYLIAGREPDLATQERLAQQLEQQGYPAGTPSQVRDSILRYREVLMNRAQDALRVENPVTVSTVEPF